MIDPTGGNPNAINAAILLAQTQPVLALRVKELEAELAKANRELLHYKSLWQRANDELEAEKTAHMGAKLELAEAKSELTATKWALESANAHLESPERADKSEAALAERDAEIARLIKALGDCYTLSRRELRKNPNDEQWGHIKRFCEETGMRPQILRASFPTEITDGGESIDATLEGK
jgi:chromosome segregation ATPase